MLNNSIYEDGNGGQLYLKSYDIMQTESLATLAYLLMFGGNVEAETKKENETGALRYDWWGNDSNDNSSNWVNSRTERTLKGIELSSSSRYKIKEAVKYDLKRLEDYGDIDIEVSFTNVNRIAIDITISEPSQTQNTSLKIVWDATQSEIIEKKTL